MNKKLWIRVYDSQETEDVQDFILSLGEEGLLGEIPVKLFFSSTNATKALSHVYDVSEMALIPLYEKYGEMNVKLQDCKNLEDDEFYQDPKPMERIACSLKRIADTLEIISDSLLSLGECVTEENLFCVSGGATVDEP